MIGTIANVTTILIGSILGGLFRKGLSERIQSCLFNAMGLAAVGVGINSLVGNMPNSDFPVLFIASLAVGSVIGTAIDLDGKFNGLVGKFSKSTLGEGLSTAIMLFCIGTLSILGPIESALNQNDTLLFTNATLDLVSSFVLASTFGMGIALSAGVLFLWQGSIYLLASQLAPILSTQLMCEISIVGGFLIFASGLSILKIKDMKTMNMLPALLVPVVWVTVYNLVL